MEIFDESLQICRHGVAMRRRGDAINLYQNVLGCISDQPFNVQKAHVSHRTFWPDSPKLNIGVTGFETVSISFLTVSENHISLHVAYSGRFS